MHIWPPADYCGFGLEHAVPIHPIFEPCLLNANVARWWNGHSSSRLPVLEYTDTNHCGLKCLNDLQNPEGLPERGVTNVKTILLKTRKPFSCRALSPMALSPYTAKMFLAASAASAPLLNSKRRLCQKCSNFSTCHSHFLASTAHSLSSNDKISICKLKNSWT